MNHQYLEKAWLPSVVAMLFGIGMIQQRGMESIVMTSVMFIFSLLFAFSWVRSIQINFKEKISRGLISVLFPIPMIFVFSMSYRTREKMILNGLFHLIFISWFILFE